jgi:hypothetical protein
VTGKRFENAKRGRHNATGEEQPAADRTDHHHHSHSKGHSTPHHLSRNTVANSMFLLQPHQRYCDFILNSIELN